MLESETAARSMLADIQRAFSRPVADPDTWSLVGVGALRSVYPVTDLACAVVAAAGLAAADWIEGHGLARPRVTVDRRLASWWFRGSLRGDGWQPPSPWDAIAGDYRAADGWIRLHTTAPAHRRAALDVLGVAGERPAVAAAVSGWPARQLEDAVVGAGGCAAQMRSRSAWQEHPQGRAVAGEPLVQIMAGGPAPGASRSPTRFDPARPLGGIRVLDLTRVLAGPVATRMLAALGATVLRIDPPDWDEPPVVPEMTVGKRCARLNLRSSAGRERLLELLADSDVLVHGYRPDALQRLGLGEAERQAVRPDLIDVALDAYGWTGPWAGRRGFDSLVQMSAGIADAGRRAQPDHRGGAPADPGLDEPPRSLPVPALDHGTGYLLAAAVLHGLRHRLDTGGGWVARASLARTAELLTAHPAQPGHDLTPLVDADYASALEVTDWGPARRLIPPLLLDEVAWHWERPARRLGSADPAWP